MRKVILLLISLTACQPSVITRPEQVDMPVAVSCVSSVPPEPLWVVPSTVGNHAQKAKAMAQDLDNAHAYIQVLEAVIDACK